MAGKVTDVRIACTFPGHPKTKKLKRRLGADGVLSLVWLYVWAAQNKPDGDLSGIPDDEIEIACDWKGAEGELISVLCECRFMEGAEGKRVLHDWADHNPWAAGSSDRSAKARWNAHKLHHGIEAADREVPEYAAVRTKRSTEPDRKQHASSMLVADAQHATSCAQSSAPLPSPSPSPYQDQEHPPINPPPADDGKSNPAAPVPPVAAEPRAQKPKAQPSTPPRPVDVTEQTWSDWLALRKAKKAPVTPTVLNSARAEAAKAGLTLEKFLIAWCASGYQGFKADWLKPNERGNGNGQSQHHRESAAERTARKAAEFIQRLDDAEAIDGECARVPNRVEALDPDG